MADASRDSWNPTQYDRFKAERSAPFYDLAGLVEPTADMDVVDLGCGTGELTAWLHGALSARSTLGIDNSLSMLAEAGRRACGMLTFEHGDLSQFDRPGQFDLVLSNAAIQWVGDHEAVLGRWTAALKPGGQLAVQMPANLDHPSHVVATDVAALEPFRSVLPDGIAADPLLAVKRPERYADLLHALGYERQNVRLQVYGHVLVDTAAVVEWVKGTTLTRFQRALPAELFDRFLAEYRERLRAALGDHAPYFYAFKRILIWGRRPLA